MTTPETGTCITPGPAPGPVDPPDDGTLAAMAKALGHPARIAILRHLANQDTCVTGDLVDHLPSPNPQSPNTSASCERPASCKAKSTDPEPATASIEPASPPSTPASTPSDQVMSQAQASVVSVLARRGRRRREAVT